MHHLHSQVRMLGTHRIENAVHKQAAPEWCPLLTGFRACSTPQAAPSRQV